MRSNQILYVKKGKILYNTLCETQWPYKYKTLKCVLYQEKIMAKIATLKFQI